MNRFRDRADAGRQLAAALASRALERPIVLALPRGGVPIGYEIARVLHAPLDVWVVRKVGVPWHPELGVGAVAEGGHVHINREILDAVDLSPEQLAEIIKREQAEVEARVRLFRADRPAPELAGQTVILVDDGIATGGTVRAAIRSIRTRRPKAILLAVPVAVAEILRELAPEVDGIVCTRTPPDLYAIGLWYADFSPLSDVDVVLLLERARRELAQVGPHASV